MSAAASLEGDVMPSLAQCAAEARASAASAREILAQPSAGLTDSDILLLTCQHTGQRINLRVDECQQHIDFARAVLAAAGVRL